MGFLVSANSFHFFRLIIKNKDLCELCVLLPTNTNKMALRQYHYLFFFLNLLPSMQHDPLLSALPNNTLTRTQVTQLSPVY